MHHNLLLILALLFSVFMMVMAAQKMKIAYPIFLVLAGLVISLVPGIPDVELDPDLVFLIFLPPLLYEAAWYTSWNDFWRWKRPISLLAFGLVFATSLIVAYVSQALIPGFTLALGFLLGGIVSPPDAVAATTVLKGLPVPKRILSILEGESLVNDASSLIVFRFALAAILTGTFSIHQAVGQFFLVAGMGIVVGLIGATFMYLIHRFLPTTSAIDAALTLMTPYLLYLGAEQFHFSGVMAVVTGGLFISYRSHEIFKNGNTRLNMLGVWTTVIFVMNAMVFVLIGLSLPSIINGLEESSLIQGIKYGVIISIIIILIRFLWVYPTTFIPRWLFKSVRKEQSPGWKVPLVIGWTGMRGVVSLATALSIPFALDNGSPFPHRNLILLITFVVIFITLVIQGLTLPFLVKKLKIPALDYVLPQEQQEAQIKIRLNRLAINHINTNYYEMIERSNLLKNYYSQILTETENTENQLDIFECNTCTNQETQRFEFILKEIYEKQRLAIFQMRREKYYDDEEIRKAELQLDLNDLKINPNFH
ncbi:Na+/H+ antiporter [Epilithonimonas vandammei]|uniref:Na+/H+ antiporter n=1 Tax=Epilithonimonas vandammei TaxID=2487072 RepID=UPI0028AE8134|nr:Na+/H+ antiporter [Epilithonimonas vandammei]